MRHTTLTRTITATLSCLALMIGVVFGFAAIAPRAAAVVDNTPDNDNVAIIKGGAFSQTTLRNICNENKVGDLDKVYAAFDIKCSDMTGMVDGVVWRDGRVTVDGKTVATDAMTAGRNFGGTPISGTKNVGKYSTSKFVTEGQTAFVKLDSNGKFLFAVVKPCGNPVSATPKPAPKPTFSCDSLTPKKISRTEYEFTAKGSADHGAKITGYRFTFDGDKTPTQSSNVITHTFKAGDHSVKVEVRVDINGTTKYVSDGDCEKTITVTPPPTPEQVPVCNPTTGEEMNVDKKDQSKFKPVGSPECTDITVCRLSDHQVVTIKESKFDSSKYSKDTNDCTVTPAPGKGGGETPEKIASTGPTEILGGGLGLGSLTAAGYYFRASRRNLIEKILNR